MQNIKYILIFLMGVVVFSSCELDNYEGPTGSLSGGIVDIETGELIQSDIINGTKIELIEEGFETPSSQRLIVKVDGSYRNDMLFESTYALPPIMGGNFVPQKDTIKLTIEGETIHNFEVLPYIRVKDAAFTVDGMAVIATFKIETTDTLSVSNLGLFAHREPSVGEPLQNGKVIKWLETKVEAGTEFSLKLKLKARDFPAGEYYFRVGALIDAPEAKYNYAPAVRLSIGE